MSPLLGWHGRWGKKKKGKKFWSFKRCRNSKKSLKVQLKQNSGSNILCFFQRTGKAKTEIRFLFNLIKSYFNKEIIVTKQL